MVIIIPGRRLLGSDNLLWLVLLRYQGNWGFENLFLEQVSQFLLESCLPLMINLNFPLLFGIITAVVALLCWIIVRRLQLRNLDLPLQLHNIIEAHDLFLLFFRFKLKSLRRIALATPVWTIFEFDAYIFFDRLFFHGGFRYQFLWAVHVVDRAEFW